MAEHNFVDLPICMDCLSKLRDSLEETIGRQITFLEVLEEIIGETEEEQTGTDDDEDDDEETY